MATLESGTIIAGRWRVTKQIGSGTFSKIFEAVSISAEAVTPGPTLATTDQEAFTRSRPPAPAAAAAPASQQRLYQDSLPSNQWYCNR
jgi:hypothetical protein